MTTTNLRWTPDLSFPAGNGATWDRFLADDGEDFFEIDTTPWGDADLKINGTPIAHVEANLHPELAFHELEMIAERIERAVMARRRVRDVDATMGARVADVVH